jgi:hypothetical protein
MNTNTKAGFQSAEQAYRLALRVGYVAADMLRIETVVAVYLNRTDILDAACRVTGPLVNPALCGLRKECGEFAADFDRGWWDGLRSRCSEIVGRLDNDSVARLPKSEHTVYCDLDGD